MAEKREDASNVMTFDALYTTNQIQKLKVLLPYIEPSMQKHLAIYIKYMEFQYTLHYVKQHPFTLSGCSLSQPEKPDLQKLCKELCLYSTQEEIRQLEQMQNFLQTMETVQEMTQTMNAMQEIFPDLSMDGVAGQPFAPSSGDASSMFSMLTNMLTPEQREMYEMFERSSSGGDDPGNGGSHEQ